jgi:hypothetical protein
VVDTYLELLE